MSNARTDAAHKRMRMHKAVATCDLDALRAAINELYDPKTSPLAGSGMKTVRAYAPMIEAAILARIFAPGSAVQKEMDLNLKHTRKSFGITDDEYASILDQLSTATRPESDSDSSDADEGLVHEQRTSVCTSTDWCIGTSMHGKVKPARHIKFFTCRREHGDGGAEDKGEGGEGSEGGEGGEGEVGSGDDDRAEE